MKYSDALKIYNKGKDKWCMPKKGSEDYDIIRNIIEKNNVINPSSKKPKVKVSKVPKVPTVPKVPKVSKVPIESKVKILKESKESKEPISINIFSNKKYSKSLKKGSFKRSSVFIKQVDSKKNAKIIANFLKNKLIKYKYSLDNRVSL